MSFWLCFCVGAALRDVEGRCVRVLIVGVAQEVRPIFPPSIVYFELLRYKLTVRLPYMAVLRLPNTATHPILVVDDVTESVRQLCSRLVASGVEFSIYSEFPDMQNELAVLNANKLIFDMSQMPRKSRVIVDCTLRDWHYAVPLVSIAEHMTAEVVILSSMISKTAVSREAELMVSPIVNFSFLPGVFGFSDAVEIAPSMAAAASAEVMGIVEMFFSQIGMKPERVADKVGLVFPRILATIINEAAFALMEGVADPKAIDDAMKLGTNYPKGPLAWADEIGLDIVYELLAGLSLEYGEPRYRPCPLLRRYVNAGYYGKEGLGGFYAIAALAGKV